MKAFSLLLKRLIGIFRRKSMDSDLDRELRSHIEAQTQENIISGMPPEQARREALRKFGGFDSVKERCRQEGGIIWLEELVRDFRFAARLLLKNPGFTSVALVTLTLGIGANTAVFQLLNAIRLKTLPAPRPHEIVEVRFAGERPGTGVFTSLNSEMTYPLWEQVRQHREPLSGVFAWSSGNLPMGRGAQARQIKTLWLSSETFSVLGIKPARGRFFEPEEDRHGAPPVGVMISDAFWRHELASAEDVIGRTLIVGDRPFPIIGVAPREFFGLEIGETFDVALPLSLRELWWENMLSRTDVWWLRIMGRLKPDWTLARADDYARTISRGVLEATVPVGYASGAAESYTNFKLGIHSAANGVSRLRNDYERSLWLLLGITGLVLLIACLNLANLTLARANSRAREIAVRVAIGASRIRLIRQILCENLLLSITGAALGAILARTLSVAIVRFLAARGTTLNIDLATDWRVLFFTSAIGILTCVIFGMAPALRASRVEPNAALRTGGRGSTASSDRLLLQKGLTIVQIAVSLVLLFGALLFVRTFLNLVTLDPGFRQDGLLYAYLDYGQLGIQKGEHLLLRQEIIEKIERLPGVESAALTSHVPLGGSSWTMGVKLSAPTPTEDTWSKVTWAGPKYFKTVGMPVIAGRDFTERDNEENSQKVAVVNETFVRRYLPNTNPVGVILKTVPEPGYPEMIYEIVGVVKDTKYGDLRGEIPPITFALDSHHPIMGLYAALVVRVSGQPELAINSVRKQIEGINPLIRMEVQSLRVTVREHLAREQLMAWLSGFFGIIALLLVIIGLYGLISYLTLMRRNEIGVRLALGAQKARILWWVFRQGFVLTAIGLFFGAIGALLLTRSLKSLLFGVPPGDLGTLALISTVLAIVACIAAWLPARRAARLDPMIALRCE